MSKFKVGDRVKSLDINAPELGYMAGTIIGKDEGDNWEISWDKTPYGRINWHDEQLAHLAPTSPVREVTKTIATKEIIEGRHSGVNVSYEHDNRLTIQYMVERPTKADLAAAADVLLELAGALDA